MAHNPHVIKAKQAVTDAGYRSVALVIEDGCITDMLDFNAALPDYPLTTIDDEACLMPGMIDMHIHGASGADVMDATPAALKKISQTLHQHGTAGFLATTLTQSQQNISAALTTVRDYLPQQDLSQEAEILGIHLEGPFLNPDKCGAQPLEYIIAPDIEQFKTWQAAAGGCIKLVTLAPEMPGGLALTEYLTSQDIIVSLGHSNATYEETTTAIDAGITHATHLFNAMTYFGYKDPGAVMALLLDERVIAELIVDGVHLHPATVNMSYRLKGADGLVLVTDAMRASCAGEGRFDLGGQTVIVKDGAARLENGVLAGSVLTMPQALRLMMQFTDCDLTVIAKLTAENPAKQLRIFNDRGSIAVGKRADLITIDQQYDVKRFYQSSVST